MQEVHSTDVPFVNSVLHPTDFTPESKNAFAHALAIALLRKTQFSILHASAAKDEWTHFPAVRSTLEQWGLLEKGSPRSAVFEKLSVSLFSLKFCILKLVGIPDLNNIRGGKMHAKT